MEKVVVEPGLGTALGSTATAGTVGEGDAKGELLPREKVDMEKAPGAVEALGLGLGAGAAALVDDVGTLGGVTVVLGLEEVEGVEVLSLDKTAAWAV